MLNNFIIISSYLFLPLAIEAAAFIVSFSVVLKLIEIMDGVIARIKA